MPEIRHGHAANGLSPEYICWQAMRQRCADMTDEKYGGAGVRISPRWDNFNNFLADMGPRPSRGHSLDRYPNRKGNYEPGNVRWATAKQQNRNRDDNRLVEFRGRNMPVSEAAEIAGLPYVTVLKRLNAGWDVAVALSKVVRPKLPNGEGARYGR